MKKKTLLVTEAVNNLLSNSAVPATLTIEQCAKALAMSMTSFRRKLSQEETSFKLIQNKFLNELCVDALLTKQVSIDDLVVKLGYSERATFERAFRHKFGIYPVQFRELAQVGSDKHYQQSLIAIAQEMPPLPKSCQQLLKEVEQDSFDMQRAIDIVNADPIFTGRVLGLASKAIYGKTPKDIQEAVSRNLGVNTVVNLAVIFGVKDALAAHVDQQVITQCTDAFLIAPSFFQLMRKELKNKVKFDVVTCEQVLVFALLGMLLLCHKKALKHQLVLHSIQGVTHLDSLNHHIIETMGISIYGASSVMLSLWHIDASIIKQLSRLDKISQNNVATNKEDDYLLFMLSCLYFVATKQQDYSELEQKAELLGLDNFAVIKTLLMNY